MKIRSGVPENGCLVFLTDEKKQKTQEAQLLLGDSAMRKHAKDC